MTNEEYYQIWANNFVKVAHTLIKPLNVTDEPFMLTEVDVEGEDCVICRCFYHTVVFTPRTISIFTNEAGGMCPISFEHHEKSYKMPNEFNYKEQKQILLQKIREAS